MTLLHDSFHLRDHQAFRRLLDGSTDRAHAGGGVGSGIGKSWTRSGTLTSVACDVNARDWQGRTVLHLACATLDSLEYLRLLLRHPSINVNLADTESHWTALHRALYNGNIPAALMLLERADTDRSLQDFEGYTAFDLYNSTLNETKPPSDAPHGDLYTWGTNRNAALGLGDAGDRAFPDQVIIESKDEWADEEAPNLSSRFLPIHVHQVQMSKLHTVIVTSESEGNLRLCGFGSGGRLGPRQHTQYSFKPLPHFPHTIVSVALGQDHTLALTKTGEVFSWGLNRFSQLGYVVDNPVTDESFGKVEEPIQAIPRKVQGALKKEIVKGVAASKGASACWTDRDVYTWGTNNGQLGYDKTFHPQILPRKAAKVTQPVLAISMTESVMACLLVTHDVICVWNDRHVRIIFPGHAFPSEMQPYRPPQAIRDAKIAKLASCDEMFAALSFNGELFIYTVANPMDVSATSGREKPHFKPQRVWALRKKYSAVKDVALGPDGSIIICTESGHVFVRSRLTKGGSGKAFKFQRVSQLQRVTQVCASSTGAFAAIRVEYQTKPIKLYGNRFDQDIASIQPYLQVYPTQERQHPASLFSHPSATDGSSLDHRHDNDSDNLDIKDDIDKLLHLFEVLDRGTTKPEESHALPASELKFPYGADVMLHLPSGVVYPSHKVILGARSRLLCAVLDGSRVIENRERNISLRLLDPNVPRKHHQSMHLALTGCQPISILIFLTFLYSDELLAIWDHRISTALGQKLRALKINVTQTKVDLCALAEVLDLPMLASALASPVKRSPSPSLGSAMQQLFQSTQISDLRVPLQSALAPDVILQLADRDVSCHSIILRARSVFFADFFGEDDWTTGRWDANGVITIDMKHINWRVMEYVLRFMCWGAEEMFEALDFANSVDDTLEFMFDLMAVANELLLDRLVLLCSTVILKHANLYNACYILSDATHLNAQELIERIQSLMAVNMELMLASRMLDDLSVTLINQLARYIRTKQAEKSPVTRSGRLVDLALARHADWLALQDIPLPIRRSSHVTLRKDSTTSTQSPPGFSKKPSRLDLTNSPQQSPSFRPHRIIQRRSSNDDIFAMDDTDVPTLLVADVATRHIPGPPNKLDRPPPIWKATSIPRVDMKVVMAEAVNESTSGRSTKTTGGSLPAYRASYRPSQDLRNISKPSEISGAAIDTGHSSGSIPARPLVSSAPSPPHSAASRASHVINSSPGPKFHPSAPQRSPGTAIVPNLGPVFIPTKQAPPSPSTAGPSIIRHTVGRAWNQPAPASQSPSTTGMSIVAIQQLELDQVATKPNKDKRSLREIQEEEKALQEEASFLAWWAAEEERVKEEARMSLMAKDTAKSKSPRKRGGKKADYSGGAPNHATFGYNQKPRGG